MPAIEGIDGARARWSTAYRLCWLIAVLLLGARLGFVLAHDPLAGFANQFDMIRTTGCLGLRPAVDVPVGAATMAAPIERYRVDGPLDSSCLPGTEVAIAATALVLDRIADGLGLDAPNSLSLRLVACVKALLLVLALVFVDWRLRAHGRARVAHAWMAALLLADPVNTLYFAGFYTEFSALLSTYLALALPLIWLLDDRPPKLGDLILWGLTLSALALSRFQHTLIPIALLAWLLVQAYGRGWRLARIAAIPLACVILALAFALELQRDYRAIGDANRWNSFFGAALPATDDPTGFVVRLGLPAHCAELAHTTWYLRRGRDARTECVEAFSLSRVRWTLALASEPRALMQFIGRGINLSGQWRPAYLGELADREYSRMGAGPLALGASLSDLVARWPFGVLTVFWGVPVMLAAGWALARARRRLLAPKDCRGTGWLWPALAMIVVSGWASSLIGDGYSELARHLHLAANAAWASVLLAGCAAIGGLMQMRARSPQTDTPKYAPGILLVLVSALAFALVLSRSNLRLGFGVLDQPADEKATTSVSLSGWAMDPNGIARIDAVTSDGRRTPLALSPHPGLIGIFGTGIGSTGVDFRGSIELPMDVATAIQIEVTANSGTKTIIDRRWMRLLD